MYDSNLLLCMKKDPLALEANPLLFPFWLSFRLRPVPVRRGPPERHLARIWEDNGLLHAPQWGKNSHHTLHAIKARHETERGELQKRLTYFYISCQAVIPAGLQCTSSSRSSCESFLFFREDSGALNGFLSYKSTKGNPGSRRDCDQLFWTKSLLIVAIGSAAAGLDRQPLNKVFSAWYCPLSLHTTWTHLIFLFFFFPQKIFFLPPVFDSAFLASLFRPRFFTTFIFPLSLAGRIFWNTRRSRGPRRSECWTGPLKPSWWTIPKQWESCSWLYAVE